MEQSVKTCSLGLSIPIVIVGSINRSFMPPNQGCGDSTSLN
jgi:hypothetical protein